MSFLAKNNRCAICLNKNLQKDQKVCNECSFINEFVTKWGRENLRAILTNHLNKHNSIRNNNLNEKIKEDEPRPVSNITLTHELSGCKSNNCSCHNRGGSFSACAPPYNPNH